MNKIFQKLDVVFFNDDKVFSDANSDVTFFSDDMGLVNVNLNKVSLDEVNSEMMILKLIVLHLWLGVININH